MYVFIKLFIILYFWRYFLPVYINLYKFQSVCFYFKTFC